LFKALLGRICGYEKQQAQTVTHLFVLVLIDQSFKDPFVCRNISSLLMILFGRLQISFIEEFENSKSLTFVLAVPHSTTLLKLVCQMAKITVSEIGIDLLARQIESLNSSLHFSYWFSHRSIVKRCGAATFATPGPTFVRQRQCLPDRIRPNVSGF